MAELKEARVPDIGDYEGVPVIEVLVEVGDTVAKDQGLVTLESDKATLEVPAPFAGIVRELKVKLGDNLAEGSVVAMIEPAGEAAEAAPAAPKRDADKGDTPPVAERAEPAAPAQQTRAAETAAKVEPVAVAAGADELAQREIEAAQPGAPSVLAPPRTPPVAFDATELMPDQVPYASPAVRLFARELGVDLMQVTGSQRGGRIGKQDVQAFVKNAIQGGGAAAAPGVAAGGGLALLPWPKVDFSKFGETENVSLSRIQKLSGANLARNWAMIPHVTQFDDADITGLEALRVELNEENAKAIAKGGATKLTMLAFLMKASVAALQKFPNFNASLDASGETLVLKQYFHIGFAADTPNGLVVPVVRDCDRKGVMQIAAETGELAAKAREGKLGPSDMSGGCFTISSLGGIGGTAFTPIINAPEVAILGVSKAAMQPVWNGKEFAPRLLLPLSLSYDHRVIDGAAAARFTAYLAALLADLRRVLL
ncbi:MAG TPA: 2-oxo acid dehydrogenase subunit E2 [Lysobacter sp.]|nr:2-oxo acid dehydrogenase subunit E2 [Lysobacter sp.]